jgi:predicted Rossmann fold flavoprotein
MMAAIAAAEGGADVAVLEKNGRPGRKLNLTGKGRCNVTNTADVAGHLAAAVRGGKFLRSALYGWDAAATMEFFESRGVALVTERGGRVFPASERAADITDALVRACEENGVLFEYNCDVQGISRGENSFAITTSRGTYAAEAVIITTGGKSYPSTGSTGAGYALARGLGHEVTETAPSLVGLTAAEPWVADLEGLSLRNVRVTAGKFKSEIGEMLFTATGISGPLILTASAYTSPPDLLSINLKPALSREQLDARILRDFKAAKNKNFANSLDELLPKRLIATIIALSDIPPDKKVNEITRAERARLVDLLTALPLTITGTGGWNEAVITCGGVCVKGVNPSTMESRLVSGLYFAGEVLDVHALTGGYNLQIAFATGRLAGRNAG